MAKIAAPSWSQLSEQQMIAIHTQIEDLVADLICELFDQPRYLSDPEDEEDVPPTPQEKYEHRLARIAAMTTIKDRLLNEIKGEVYSIATSKGLEPRVTDLARVVGLTREGARSRYGDFLNTMRPHREEIEEDQ